MATLTPAEKAPSAFLDSSDLLAVLAFPGNCGFACEFRRVSCRTRPDLRSHACEHTESKAVLFPWTEDHASKR